MERRQLVVITAWLISLLVIIAEGETRAQSLKRRGFLGIGMYGNPPDSVRVASGAPDARGVWVQFVVPGSTAEQLRLQPLDIITHVNDRAVTNNTEVVAAVKDLKELDPVRVKLLRKGQEMELKGQIAGRPRESSETVEVRYDEVAFGDGKLRCIFSTPKSNPDAPIIYFIQGFSCGSIDYLPANDPYRNLINGLLEKGYAVFRLEKPGVGDSEATPACDEIDFSTELEAFKAGYRKLRQYDAAARRPVYIFGHSLGGITAPLLAQEFQPAGVMVYGTVLRPWKEYLQDVYRIQRPLYGADSAETEARLQTYRHLFTELFEKETEPRTLAENSSYLEFMRDAFEYDGEDKFFGRHYTYVRDLAQINLVPVWKKFQGRVLAIYGEADVAALNPADHLRIIELVNEAHPGNGTYHFMPRTSHAMCEVGSMMDYVTGSRQAGYTEREFARFNRQLLDVLDRWIRGITS